MLLFPVLKENEMSAFWVVKTSSVNVGKVVLLPVKPVFYVFETC